MCVIAFSYRSTPGYQLVLVGNRDEFYNRPTDELHWWQPENKILAGKDLTARGTWLGVSRNGRWAFVTNIREPRVTIENPKSRGLLVSDFLNSEDTPAEFYNRHKDIIQSMAGFNLVVGEQESAMWFCNRQSQPVSLNPGVYTLSNAQLDTPWYKSERLKKNFLSKMKTPTVDIAFEILKNTTLPSSDALVQQSGLSFEQEKALSPIFLKLPGYGTRSCSFLTITDGGIVDFHQRNFDENSQSKTQQFNFQI